MEKANIGFKAGLMKPHSPPGGSHVRIRYTSNGETVCCISGKSDTTYQKDKR